MGLEARQLATQHLVCERLISEVIRWLTFSSPTFACDFVRSQECSQYISHGKIFANGCVKKFAVGWIAVNIHVSKTTFLRLIFYSLNILFGIETLSDMYLR